MIDKQQIGQRIYELRIKSKLNQKNFSEAIGISQQGLSQIENGIILPSIEVLQKITSRFGIDYRHIIDGMQMAMETDNISNKINDNCKLCEEKTERIKELKEQISLLTNINEDIKQQLNMKKDILMECMEHNRMLSKELEILQDIINNKIITDKANAKNSEKKSL